MLKFSCAAVTKTAGSAPNKDNFELGGKCAPMNHGDFSAAYEGDSKEPFIAAVAGGTEHITKGKYASFMVCRDLAYTDGNLPADFGECAENMSDAILNSNDMVCETIKNEEAGSSGITIASALFADGRMRYTNLGNAGIYLFRDGKLRKLTEGNASHNADNADYADKIDLKQDEAEAAAPETENIKVKATEAGSDFQTGVPDANAAGRTELPSDNFYENYEGSEEKAEIHIPESVFLPEEERLYSDGFELDGKLIFALPEYKDLQLMKGDKILICGESVFSHISEDEIKEILNSKDSVSEKVGALVSAARKNSAGADMTAVLIDVERSSKLAAFIGEMNVTRYIGLGLILCAIIIVLVFYLPVLLNHSPVGGEPTPVPITFSPEESPTPDAVITGREETSPTPSNTDFFSKVTPSPGGGSTGVFPGRTDEPKPTDTAVPTSTPNPTQTSKPTTVPRPTPGPTPVPTPRPTPPLVPPTPTDEPEPTDEPPVTQEPPTEEPPTEEPPTEQPPTDEPPTEEPPTEQPPTEQPPTEQPPTEQPPTDEPPVTDEPPTEEPPGE